MKTSNPKTQSRSPSAEHRTAPLARRLLAAVTDVALVGCLALAVGLMRVDIAAAAGGSLSEMVGVALEVAATASVVAIVMGLAHEIVGVAVWGRTLGKWAFDLAVRRTDGQDPVGWYAASIRAGVPFVSGLAPMVGQFAPAVVYGWLLRDQDRQGLHDKAAGTVVVWA